MFNFDINELKAIEPVRLIEAIYVSLNGIGDRSEHINGGVDWYLDCAYCTKYNEGKADSACRKKKKSSPTKWCYMLKDQPAA
jgi:hypothetical protein